MIGLPDENIRDDIFPHLQDTLLWRREEEIRRYLEETQTCLDRLFPTLADLIEYLNGFDSPQDVELLISVCKFYNIAKNYANHPFLKFIMMISVFEKLSCGRYLSFHDWLVMRENRETLENSIAKIEDYDSLISFLNKSYQDYVSLYGLTSNLFRFFKEHLTENEKIELVRSFHVSRKQCIERDRYVLSRKHGVARREYENIEECSRVEGQPLEERLLPHCYDWKDCYLEYGRCCPDVACILKGNEELLDEELKRIINIIYDYRSKFVHGARAPPFSGNGVDFVSDVYNERPITIYFNLDELQEMLEDSLKRHFDRLQS